MEVAVPLNWLRLQGVSTKAALTVIRFFFGKIPTYGPNPILNTLYRNVFNLHFALQNVKSIGRQDSWHPKVIAIVKKN